MSLYYFLATLLPGLQLGEKPELSYTELKDLLQANLEGGDLRQTTVVSRLIDIENLRAVWSGQPVDMHGNLDMVELSDLSLADERKIPPYLQDFLQEYETPEKRVAHYPQLLAQFFQAEIAAASGFLKEYLQFERQMRLCLVAFRACRYKRDLKAELQYEDLDDQFVMQILAQADSQQFMPPQGFEGLKSLFDKNADHPLSLHRALIEYRLDFIRSRVEDELFSLSRILGYQASVIALEQWNALDGRAGGKVIESLLKDVP